METSNQILLDIAFEDLEASKLLFNQNLFPQSIFYLQQSVEKTVKYLGLSNEVISREELHDKIGHRVEKIFKKVIGETSHLTGESKEKVDQDYNKLLQIMRSNDLSVFKNDIVNLLKDYRNQKFDKEVLKSLIDATVKSIDPEFYENTLEDATLQNFIRKKKDDFIKHFPDYVISVQVLFVLNSILSEYTTKARYPILENFTNPSNIFNHEHSLVELLPLFFENAKYSIKSISNIELIN